MSLPQLTTIVAMSATGSADLAVVGLGAFGAAVAYQATALGLDVVGFDRYHPPHDFGSSHAETRVTRLAVGEGAHYVPFAQRSHEIWREVGAATGSVLLHDYGGLIIAPTGASSDERWGSFVDDTATVAAGADLDFEQLSAAESRARFPNFLVGDDEVVGREPTAGTVMADEAIAAQLHLANDGGADLRFGSTVTGLGRSEGRPIVRTSKGDIAARHVVVAAGAWAPSFHDRERLRVTRQVVFWFEAENLETWRPDHVSFAIWARESIDEYLGAFGAPWGGIPGVKVLGEQFVDTTSPEAVDRTVSPTEIATFYERMVEPRLSGLTPNCVKAAVCLYTNTDDDHFLIDAHPEHPDVTVVSACSGHGFKHSAAIGEALARRSAGHDHLDLTPFHRARF